MRHATVTTVTLKVLLSLSIAAVASATAIGLAKPQSVSRSLLRQDVALDNSISAIVGEAANMPQVEVVVNGQEIDTSHNGISITGSGPNRSVVRVSGGGSESNVPSQITTTTNANGTLNVTVSSNSGNASTNSHTFINSSATSSFFNGSTTSTHSTATGNIHINK